MILVAIYFICRESLAWQNLLGEYQFEVTWSDQNATQVYKSQEFVVRFLFAFRDKYIILDADGEETVKSCPCCHSPPAGHFHTVPQGMIKSDWIIVSDLVRSCHMICIWCHNASRESNVLAKDPNRSDALACAAFLHSFTTSVLVALKQHTSGHSLPNLTGAVILRSVLQKPLGRIKKQNSVALIRQLGEICRELLSNKHHEQVSSPSAQSMHRVCTEYAQSMHKCFAVGGLLLYQLRVSEDKNHSEDEEDTRLWHPLTLYSFVVVLWRVNRPLWGLSQWAICYTTQFNVNI